MHVTQDPESAHLKDTSWFQFNDVLVSFAMVTNTPRSQDLLQKTFALHFTIHGFRSAALNFAQTPRLKVMLLFEKWGLRVEGKEHKPTCHPLSIGSSSFCQMWHESHLLIALAPLGRWGGH